MTTRSHAPVVVALATTVAVLGLFAHPAAASDQGADAGRSETGAAAHLTAERPAGQVVLSDLSLDDAGHIRLTVVDTRAEDPGWSVSVTVSGGHNPYGWSPNVGDHTPPFTDSNGHFYAQEVSAGYSVQQPAAEGGTSSAVLASAPARHGLGISHLDAIVTGSGVISLTVV